MIDAVAHVGSLLQAGNRNRAFARPHLASLIVVALIAVGGPPAHAQDELPKETAPRQSLGFQAYGTVGSTWLASTKSLDATGLESRPTEVGAGAQVTTLWRDLFCEVAATQTSSSGERVFVDPSGTVFRLGIPLSVKVRYIDVAAGWKSPLGSQGKSLVTPYVAAGVGRVMYRESSPFAESGDDVDLSATSYHVKAGLEVRLVEWLSVSGDARYRWVPDLLGEGGASADLGEDDFGGFHAGVSLRLVFGGSKRRAAADPAHPETDQPAQRDVPGAIQRDVNPNSAVVVERAPAFLRMDATLEPLRTLEAGTTVIVLAELEEWVRIEFNDRLLGRRIGYVQRKYVRLPK